MRLQGRALRGGAPLPGLALDALILLLWLSTFLLARAVEHAPHASLWFPPAAVTFAALLVVGVRALPAVIVSCVGATVLTEMTYNATLRPGVLVASSLAFTVVHVAAYGLLAALLRRLAGRDPTDVTLRAVTLFLFVGAGAAVVAAIGGVFVLRATGLIAGDVADIRLIAAWGLGDYVALLTLAPLFTRWMVRAAGGIGAHGASRFSPFRTDVTPFTRAAMGKLASLWGVTLAVVAIAFAVDERGILMAVLVLPLVLQLWIVHTESRAAALRGVVGFSLLTVGAGAMFDAGSDAITLQFAAIALAANTYLGLAVPALYAANEQLRAQVTHDRLTRVLSRAYFEDRAMRELERAQAAGMPIAVVLFDLDGLKSINDAYGHAVGDAALREVADRVSGAVGPGDLVGRLSGDEFAVLLPGADASAADAAIARMRHALEQARLDDVDIALRASFGASSSGPDAMTLNALLHDADAAMYADKRRQRSGIEAAERAGHA